MTRSRSSAWLCVITAMNAPSGARDSNSTGSPLRDCRDIRRKYFGNRARPRVDPGDGERKRRERHRERASDMARAEQIERSRLLAEPFDHAPVRLNLVGRPACAHRSRSGARAAHPCRSCAVVVSSAHALGLRQPRDGLTVGRAEALESSAARVRRSIVQGPVRARWSIRDTAGPSRRASSACASASAAHSSAPPPIVPVNAPSGATTMRAPASRGLEPFSLRQRHQRRRAVCGDEPLDGRPDRHYWRHSLHCAQNQLPGWPVRRAAPAHPG